MIHRSSSSLLCDIDLSLPMLSFDDSENSIRKAHVALRSCPVIARPANHMHEAALFPKVGTGSGAANDDIEPVRFNGTK
jgi:hypothetical protein